MFIAGVVVGPALAIVAWDGLFKSGRIKTSWAWIAMAALMLVIVVMPFFASELKFGLLIGLPLGLVLAMSPMALTPVGSATEPGARL
jgi:hypothetical protein